MNLPSQGRDTSYLQRWREGKLAERQSNHLFFLNATETSVGIEFAFTRRLVLVLMVVGCGAIANIYVRRVYIVRTRYVDVNCGRL